MKKKKCKNKIKVGQKEVGLAEIKYLEHATNSNTLNSKTNQNNLKKVKLKLPRKEKSA